MNIGDDNAHFKSARNIVNELVPLGRHLTSVEQRHYVARYRDHHDAKAYEILEGAFYLKIKKIALSRGLHSDGLDLEDKIQHGRIGFFKAVQSFDLSADNDLDAYARHKIFSEIHAAIHATHSIVKPPRGEWTRRKNISTNEHDRFNSREGLEPVLDRRKLAPEWESLTEPNSDLDDLHDHVEALANAPGLLSERERLVFKERLLTDDRPTLGKLSSQLGISRERVRQVEGVATAKVKAAADRGAHHDTDRARLARKVAERQFQHSCKFHLRRFQRDLIDELARPKHQAAGCHRLAVEAENPAKLKRAREAFSIMQQGRFRRLECSRGARDETGASSDAPEREGKDGKIYRILTVQQKDAGGWIDWPPCLKAAA